MTRLSRPRYCAVALGICVGAPLLLPVAGARAGAVSGRQAAVAGRTDDPPTSVAPEERSSAVQVQPQTDEKTGVESSRTLDLSSPRATMRTFLVAIQAADGKHPERIEDAVGCLDTSQLKDNGRSERAQTLAHRLHELIEKKGVKLDDIPEQPEGEAWFFVQRGFDEEIKAAPQIAIALDRDTGQWRFTAHTLASIPALEKAPAEQAPDEPPTAAESRVPVARRSPRATMATFLEAMNVDPANFDQAIQCLDSTGKDPAVWEVRGKELATKLKNVMDKIEEVVLTEIQVAPGETEYVWYTSKIGNIVIGRVEEEPPEKAEWRFAPKRGEWRFTAQTLATISALYDEFEKKEIVPELQEAGIEEELTLGLRFRRYMPEWLRGEFLQVQGWQWLVLAALLPVGWLIKVIASAITGLFLRSWLRRHKLDIGEDARRRTARSAGAVLAVLFWLYVIKNLGLPEEWLSKLLPVTSLMLALAIVWFGYRVVDIVGGHIAATTEVRLTRFDDVLIPLLRTVLRLFVVLVVLLFVVEWMEHDWKTVLGALGIGGVALAFAAQDTIGNFFGSITVLFDRPFGIGDWIVIGDVEGMVERVGFRSTRVRTFYNSIITIPNSKMVNTQVDNYGARRYRRAKIMLSITYATPPEKIDAFCEGIRELVRLHPYTRKDYYHIYLNKFAASSLDILLYVFFEVPDWGTELRERHRLFVDILRLAARLGVEFAFPTQTVWLQRAAAGKEPAERIAMTPGGQDPDSIGMAEAAKLFEEVYGPSPSPQTPVVIDTTPRSRRAQQKG